MDIILGNDDNDFLVSARDIHGKSLTDGFGNGGFDLDAFVAAHTVAAVASQAIDISGSSLVGEVVNSRIVVTFDTAADYGTGGSKGIIVRGTIGNNISETIAFANSAEH